MSGKVWSNVVCTFLFISNFRHVKFFKHDARTEKLAMTNIKRNVYLNVSNYSISGDCVTFLDGNMAQGGSNNQDVDKLTSLLSSVQLQSAEQSDVMEQDDNYV